MCRVHILEPNKYQLRSLALSVILPSCALQKDRDDFRGFLAGVLAVLGLPAVPREKLQEREQVNASCPTDNRSYLESASLWNTLSSTRRSWAWKVATLRKTLRSFEC